MGLYRKVGCAFWEGELMEELRGDMDAVAVAHYLMTCPSTNQIGAYRLASATICDDLGIDSQRASQALRKLSETGFVVVDERFRMVFVVEAARHEWGEHPNPDDNRVKGLRNALPNLLDVARKSLVWRSFWDRYGEPWASVLEGLEKPSGEGLAKGLRRASGRVPKHCKEDQDQELGSGSGKKAPTEPAASGAESPPKKLNPQAEKVRRLEEFYAGKPVKAPAPSLLAKWLSVMGGDVGKTLAFLDDMENRGKLGTVGYCGQVIVDWSPKGEARDKPRGRFSQPHTIAPGSSGKDHGIDY